MCRCFVVGTAVKRLPLDISNYGGFYGKEKDIKIFAEQCHFYIHPMCFHFQFSGSIYEWKELGNDDGDGHGIHGGDERTDFHSF